MTIEHVPDDAPSGNPVPGTPEYQVAWQAAQAEILAIAQADTQRCLEQSLPGGKAPSPWFAKFYRRRLVKIATERRSIDCRRPAPRARQHTPRRAASPAAKASTPTKSSDDPPGPARLVNQRSALAVLGWPSRFYLEFIKRKSVPHVVVRRLHIARCDDILEAREAQIIRLQAGARKRGSR
jgi:hypothetical protein